MSIQDAAIGRQEAPAQDGKEQALRQQLGADIAYPKGACVAGRFEVVGVLGKGGLAIVYDVKDRLNGERLALKIIRPSRLRVPGIRECLIYEVLLGHRLRHPHVVPIFSLFEEKDTLFFTMERIDGRTLRDVLIAQAPLSLEDAVEILVPLCDALDHCHRTMVHRDVSPENVMVGPKGVTLLDFGSAKLMHPKARVLPVLGKGHYVAPEQRLDSTTVDPRADIYPLGVMLFEMLVNRTFLKPLEKDLNWPTLSPECNRLLSRTLVPVEKRFETAGEFRQGLEACLRPPGKVIALKNPAFEKEAAAQAEVPTAPAAIIPQTPFLDADLPPTAPVPDAPIPTPLADFMVRSHTTATAVLVGLAVFAALAVLIAWLW